MHISDKIRFLSRDIKKSILKNTLTLSTQSKIRISIESNVRKTQREWNENIIVYHFEENEMNFPKSEILFPFGNKIFQNVFPEGLDEQIMPEKYEEKLFRPMNFRLFLESLL